MKVILNTDIPNLGEEGDIKTVARGYARNYLIPKNLVMPYTPDAVAILESRRERLEQRREEKRKAAMDIKTRLESEDLVLKMPAGERGRLFGSVTTATIADALAAQGISIERRRLELPEKTIKMVGTTRVRVRLYGDEEAELKVVVEAAGGTPAPGQSQPAAEAAQTPPAAESQEEAAAGETTAEETSGDDAAAEDGAIGEEPAVDKPAGTDEAVEADEPAEEEADVAKTDE